MTQIQHLLLFDGRSAIIVDAGEREVRGTNRDYIFFPWKKMFTNVIKVELSRKDENVYAKAYAVVNQKMDEEKEVWRQEFTQPLFRKDASSLATLIGKLVRAQDDFKADIIQLNGLSQAFDKDAAKIGYAVLDLLNRDGGKIAVLWN